MNGINFGFPVQRISSLSSFILSNAGNKFLSFVDAIKFFSVEFIKRFVAAGCYFVPNNFPLKVCVQQLQNGFFLIHCS
jgi:hypothetical protein